MIGKSSNRDKSGGTDACLAGAVGPWAPFMIARRLPSG